MRLNGRPARPAEPVAVGDLVEYALILVLIAIVVIGILTLLGNKVSQVFSSINSGLS